MTIPRRSLLSAGVAAPLAATVGGLALPSRAVAQAPADYHLRKRLTARVRPPGASDDKPPPGNDAPFAATVDALSAVLGTVSVDTVLANANSDGTRIETAEGRNIAEQYAFGFHWAAPDDQKTGKWRPQGISTNHDSFGMRASTIMVAWYHRPKKKNQGIRLSLVDWSAGRPKYEHVLMVEPYRTPGGLPTFAPIYKGHAGGIAWYGNTLYVADTYAGLRVFDLTRIMRVRNDRPKVVGLITGGNGDAGDYYGYNYRYVLPQIAAYDNRGRRFRYSAISVDRTGSRHTMLASEYIEKGEVRLRRPKLLRLPLTELHNAPNELVGIGVSSVTRPRGGRIVGQHGIQGAVSVNDTYYLSVSAGEETRGTLYSWKPGATRPSPRSTLSYGPEDLSYDRTENVLWTCGEYNSFRYVYAVDPAQAN